MRHPRTRTLVMIVGLALVGGFAVWQVTSLTKRVEPLPNSNAHPEQPASMVESVSKPPRPDDSYIGSAACSGCHAEIAERYAGSAMGRSLAKVTEASAPHEDYEQRTSFHKGPWMYRVERKGGQVWHHEVLTDAEGVIYDQAEEIQYAMGSNTRGRSYLMWRDGAMFLSPIAWYTEQGWDLSPGYQLGRHQRFRRQAIEACVWCHSGRVVMDSTQPDHFPQPVFHEMSIGCERCHGPGQAHAEHHKRAESARPDPLVKLSQLGATERDAVCYQCHFQGKGRILRYGRAEGDFRPGQKVSDVWTIFVAGTRADGGQTDVVSQAMQMQLSRCYQASGGQMGCVSCHDPHQSPEPAQKVEFYNRRCQTCHEEHGCTLDFEKQQAAPAQGACIHCHMPALQAKSVPHTSQSDHRILRRPAQRKSVPRDAEPTIFDGDGVQLSDAERARAQGLMWIRWAERPRNRRLAAEGVEVLQQARYAMPDDIEIPLALGDALAILGNNREAEALWQQVLAKSPHHSTALIRLANAAHDAGRYADADPLYSQAIELNSWSAPLYERWAHTLGMLGRSDLALAEANRALELDPTLLPLYDWLAEAYAARGDLERSQHFRRTSQRLSKIMNNRR